MGFDAGGLSYGVVNTTDVEVTARASDSTATAVFIPSTVSDGSAT